GATSAKRSVVSHQATVGKNLSRVPDFFVFDLAYVGHALCACDGCCRCAEMRNSAHGLLSRCGSSRCVQVSSPSRTLTTDHHCCHQLLDSGTAKMLFCNDLYGEDKPAGGVDNDGQTYTYYAFLEKYAHCKYD